MSTSRTSMPTKPVQGYTIIDGGLVWYPISEDGQSNDVFLDTYAQQIGIKDLAGTKKYKTPRDYFLALTRHYAFSEEQLYKSMLRVIRQRLKADEFKQALIATQNGYLYRDSYTEDSSMWDGGKDGKGKNLLGRALMEVRNELFTGLGQKDLIVDLNSIFEQAVIERAKKTETGVALHAFAKPLVTSVSINANTSVITPVTSALTDTSSSTSNASSSPTGSLSLSTSDSSSASSSSSASASSSVSSPSSSSSSSSTSSSVPSSPTQLTSAKLEEIKTKLGGAWTYRQGSQRASDPTPYVVFENEEVPSRILSFEIRENKISTDNTDDATLAKMLEAFTLLNPGKSPSITVGNQELKDKWIALCHQRNIIAEIKVNAPAVEQKADVRAAPPREEEKEESDAEEFDSNTTVQRLTRQVRSHSPQMPHGHERALVEEIKEAKENPLLQPSPSTASKTGLWGSHTRQTSPSRSSRPLLDTSSTNSLPSATPTPR
jgi:hypothetical protein